MGFVMCNFYTPRNFFTLGITFDIKNRITSRVRAERTDLNANDKKSKNSAQQIGKPYCMENSLASM